MNSMKKIIVLVGLAALVSHVEAAAPVRKEINQQTVNNAMQPKNKQQLAQEQEDVTLEQMQQMQEFVNAIVVMVTVSFFKKYPKFIASLVTAYDVDPSTVEQKVVTHVQKYMKDHGDKDLALVLNEMDAGQNAQAVVQQVKPFVENFLAVEIVKWIHIAAMSKVKI